MAAAEPGDELALGSIAALMFAFPEGRGCGALLLEAAAELDPRLDPAVALQPEAAAREALLTHGCWEEAVPGFDDIDATEMLAKPENGELLGEVLTACCASDSDAALGPLLVVHGEADQSLPPELTSELVRKLCAAGVAVEYLTYPDTGHDEVMAASADDAARWLADRLVDDDLPSNCAGL